MTMQTTHDIAAPTTTLLDDLLLDAQHELEAAELPTLGDAVARARVTLITNTILEREPPLRVPCPDPNELAPGVTGASAPPMKLAEHLAVAFYHRYRELAPTFGLPANPVEWDDLGPSQQQVFVATAAAVLEDLGGNLSAPAATH